MDQKAPGSEDQPDGQQSRFGGTPRLVRDRYDVVRTYATLGSVGLAFVFAVVIGTGVGLWLDRLTGWSPAFTFVFFVLGLSAGIINVYRTVSRMK